MPSQSTPRNLPHHAVAVAACAVALGAPSDGNLYQVQVLPASDFTPRDGRAMRVPAWRIDAQIAQRVIERFRALRTPLVVDYEHQTLLTETNGQPAPAAGFFRDLQWVDGTGLVATIELTARAVAFVAAGEYRFFSPVFSYDPGNGEILRINMGALTNNPAIDGMQQVSLLAAARFGLDINQETPMDLMQKIREALGLPADADEAAVLAAISALKAPAAEAAALRAELGVAADADQPAVIAACAALKSQRPDPAKYVPVETANEMRTQLAALTARVQQRDVSDLIAPALADGRLLPAQETWARELGASNVAALTSYLDLAQPIAALRGTQTGGQPPAGGSDTLTDSELAVCRQTGISAEAYLKSRKSLTARTSASQQ